MICVSETYINGITSVYCGYWLLRLYLQLQLTASLDIFVTYTYSNALHFCLTENFSRQFDYIDRFLFVQTQGHQRIVGK